MTRTVTDLKPQRRRIDRFNVFLDGEYAFSLEALTAARLQLGQVLTEKEIEELTIADNAESAKQAAFRYLSYRPRSVAEVRQYLHGKEIDEVVVDGVITRLIELEMLDDLAFARYWVDQRESFKPRSRRALKHELFQKGLSRQIVDRAVAEVDDTAAARKAARKQASRWANLTEDEFRLKLRGYLSRRGFDYATISQVSHELWQDMNRSGGLNLQ